MLYMLLMSAFFISYSLTNQPHALFIGTIASAGEEWLGHKTGVGNGTKTIPFRSLFKHRHTSHVSNTK